MLLVLDNFEHLLDAAPETGALLSACPNLMLLATSREPLHLAAERGQAVPPMNEADAVKLFVERSGTPGRSETIAELCRRLDYLPLAVELAAARTELFAPEEILERLDRRLQLLTGGPRDAPDRQKTLRATIEWSYSLLTPAEQTAFTRLGVFVGVVRNRRPETSVASIRSR